MKTYRALLNQSGNNPPTATVLENTVGNIIWSYNSDGMYIGELSGGFPKDKTFIQPIALQGDDTTYGVQLFIARVTDNSLAITTFDGNGNPANGLLGDVAVEVLVY